MEAYARYGPALLRKARRMLGNPADAEDVVQSLFVELMQRGDGGRGASDLPYLFRALTTRCLNHIRDGGNRARLLARQEPALRGLARTRCDEEVIGVDLLLKVVDHLDDVACAEVLVYRYVDDLTQDEIADLQSVSRKTVGARLARVRASVRALVGEPAATKGVPP